MRDKCQECSSTDKSKLILMSKTVGNAAFPKYYCSDCIEAAMKTFNPKLFPKDIKPDTVVIKEILNADTEVFNRCWDIFNQKSEFAKTCPGQLLGTRQKEYLKNTLDNSSPKTIFGKVSERVIGQEDAKKVLAVAIRRKAMAEANPAIGKLNLLFVGPTASGKTELARVASDMLDAPFITFDCSQLTPAGYRGTNPEAILLRLFQAAKGNMERAQRGIVLLDEFDKLVREGEFKGRIQQELLKIMEGDVINFEVDRNKSEAMDTSRILFIASGSFQGIERIVSPKKKSISLSGAAKLEIVTEEKKSPITAKHLIEYGLIRELVGRFTHIATLNKLGTEELFSILTEKKGNLASEYKEIFKEMGHDVEFPKEFLMDIAKKASNEETGARNLRFLMEEALGGYIFEETVPEEFLAKKKGKEKISA